MEIVEQRDSDGNIIQDEEIDESNVTIPPQRPSHARKKREEENGL